jgi:predicted  nucleic acid-binding Zn-ribbon protein
MTINVNVLIDLSPSLRTFLEESIVARLDELKALNASADAALSRVAVDVSYLKDKIAALEAKVAAGDTFTAEEEAELQALKEKLEKLDPVPENPPAPPE